MNKNNQELRYNDISKKFLEKGCKIITTLEEYIKMTDEYKKVNIIASCGHERKNVFIHEFFNRGCGNRCLICVKKDTKDKLISKKITCNEIEYLAFNLFKEYLSDFNVEKTVEGCLVDIILKPKINNDDLYLPFQLKSTLDISQINSSYSFTVKKDKYKNMFILLVCIKDKKVWIMSNNDIDTKGKICIGRTSKKYKKFEVDINKLNETIIQFFNNKLQNINLLNTKEFFNIPKQIYQQREQEYIKLRETKINFLNFKKPFIDHQVYDFLVNNIKFQEKVIGKYKNKYYYCNLSKNGGIINGKILKKSYQLDDNDFYWLNLSDKNTFYIFPQNILYDNNKLNQTKNIMLLIPDNDINHWTYKYRFEYNNLNKNMILQILNINENKIVNDEKVFLENIKKISYTIPKIVKAYESICKNIKQPKNTSSNTDNKHYICLDCNINISDLSIRCRKCCDIFKLKISIKASNRPSLDQLNADLKELKSFVKVGLKYKVSDNCIRKWIRKYNSL